MWQDYNIMQYANTKRDITMFEWRSEQIRLPTDIIRNVVLDKYEATEKRLNEVHEQLTKKHCPIQRLEIRQNQMNDEKIKILCKAISNNKSLTALIVTRCRLRSQQLVAICQSINKQKSQSIQELQFNQLRINKQGAEAIASVLSQNVGLQRLHLSDAGIDCESMLELCNGLRDSMSMEYLDLRHNIFDTEGLQALIKALEEINCIKHLYLESMRIDKKEAKMLAGFLGQNECAIEELELSEADLDIESLDIVMEALVKADQLRRLSLTKNILTFPICEHLSAMPSRLHKFQSLCLSHCDIDEKGLKLLCQGFHGTTTVKYLDLSWNNIQTDGMQFILTMLSKNSTLEKLYIQHNYLGEEGAHQMVEALKLHPQMRYLDISANEIGSKGFMYFCELFKSNSPLENLHVRKNEIKGEEVKMFPKSLYNNTNLFYLDLKDNQLDDELGDQITKLLEEENYFIEDLNILGNLHMSQSYKETINEECRKNLMIKAYILPRLRQLAIEQIGNNQVQIDHFKNYDAEELDLQDMSFYHSDFIVKFIKMNRDDFHTLTLRRVHFEEHANSLSKFLKKSQNTKITKLTLEDCDIGETSVSRMIQDCRNLKHLEELHLVRMGLNEANHLKEILEALYDHGKIKVLDLSYNNIEGLSEIASLAVKNQHIYEIYLNEDPGGNQVVNTKEDYKILKTCLQKNISIRKLEFGISKSLKTGPNAITEEELGEIEKQLDINRDIKQTLQHIQIERKNKGTDKIDLSGIEVEVMIDAVIKAFCIPGPSKIRKKKLILRDCKITDEILTTLISGIIGLKGPDLEIDILDLSNNFITEEGCEKIIGLIMPNFNVRSIIMSQNIEIKTEGFRRIMQGLKKNTQLRELHFELCDIELDGNLEQEVLKQVDENCGLNVLNLKNNLFVHEEFHKKLDEELEQNRQIVENLIPQMVKIQQQQLITKKKKIKKERRASKNVGLMFDQKLLRQTTGTTTVMAKKSPSKIELPSLNDLKLDLKKSSPALKKQTSLRKKNYLDLDSKGGLEISLHEITEEEHSNASAKRPPAILVNHTTDSVQQESSDSDQPEEFRSDNGDENEMNSLTLKGMNIKNLDFLSKYMKFNPTAITSIDFGDHRNLEDKDVLNFVNTVRDNKYLSNVNVAGLTNLKDGTRTILCKEVEKNKMMRDLIADLDERNEVSMGTSITGTFDPRHSLGLRNRNINNFAFLPKFTRLQSTLRFLDLSDNNLGIDGCMQLAQVIKDTVTIEEIVLVHNRISTEGLQYICSALAQNNSVRKLDISSNQIPDEALKILLSTLYRNIKLAEVEFTVKNSENIHRRNQFLELEKAGKTCDEIEFELEIDHTDAHIATWERVAFCVCCWKSFIHDKHEAFRFKYCPTALKMVDEDVMPQMTYLMYFNALVYYVIVFVCPFLFAKKCGKGIKYEAYYIYGGYSVYTLLFELITLWRLQSRINNPNVFSLNKWHFVELLFGQIARFDIYMCVCFFVLMFQCKKWEMAVPIAVFFFMYLSYPLYVMIRWATCPYETLAHTLPNIEKNCNLAYIRENMLLATVLDSFCIDNSTRICDTEVPFGRFMAIFTLMVQDGPQMIIHILFYIFVHDVVPHTDKTVKISLVAGALAIAISIFNVIMVAPNEFDPILLMLELRRRQDTRDIKAEAYINERDRLKNKLKEFKQNRSGSVSMMRGDIANIKQDSMENSDQKKTEEVQLVRNQSIKDSPINHAKLFNLSTTPEKATERTKAATGVNTKSNGKRGPVFTLQPPVREKNGQQTEPDYTGFKKNHELDLEIGK